MELLTIIISRARLGGAAGLLGKEKVVDVGHHTTVSNGDSPQKLREFLVVPHRQLDVPGDYPSLLVVPRRVSSELQDLFTRRNRELDD